MDAKSSVRKKRREIQLISNDVIKEIGEKVASQNFGLCEIDACVFVSKKGKSKFTVYSCDLLSTKSERKDLFRQEKRT